ncbi:hypothetical protein ISS07_01525 [Candidatus Woesearchaeota archaeon]|nr:hypothetical protein [Candidatus Woesearchaeota archaeon]
MLKPRSTNVNGAKNLEERLTPHSTSANDSSPSGRVLKLKQNPSLYFIDRYATLDENPPESELLNHSESEVLIGDTTYDLHHLSLDEAVEERKDTRWSKKNPILIVPYLNEGYARDTVTALQETYGYETPILVVGENFVANVGKNERDDMPSGSYLRSELKQPRTVDVGKQPVARGANIVISKFDQYDLTEVREGWFGKTDRNWTFNELFFV